MEPTECMEIPGMGQGKPMAGIQIAIFDSIGILAHGKYNMYKWQ